MNIATDQLIVGGDVAGQAGKVEITNDVSAEYGLLIEGSSTQSADIFRYQNASGTPLVTITAAGSIGVQDMTCTNCLSDQEIGADAVGSSELADTDTPADEECLTYEATGATLEWQSCGTGSADATPDVATSLDSDDDETNPEISVDDVNDEIDFDPDEDGVVELTILSDGGIDITAHPTDGRCAVLREGADDGTARLLRCVPNSGLTGAADITYTTDADGRWDPHDLITAGTAAFRDEVYFSWVDGVHTAGDDLLVKANGALTLVQLDCVVTGATTPSVTVNVVECTNAGASCANSGLAATVSTTTTNVSDTTATDAAIDDGDWWGLDLTTLTTEGDVTHCTVEFTRDD